MKKFFFAALAAVTVLFAACGNNPNEDDPNNPPVNPGATTTELGIYGVAWYGDYYQNGTTNFFVQLIEDMDDFNGAYVMFDLCAATNNIEGTYTAASTGAAGTFVVGDETEGTGSLIGALAGGSIDGDMEAITDGTLVVTKSGNNYKFVYTSGDGMRVYVAEGAAEISNGAFPLEPMEATNFTVNATSASASYYGDPNGYGADEYLVEFEGNFGVALDLYTSNGASASALPAGTYSVAGTGAPNTIMAGMYYQGYLFPSIVYVPGADGISTAWYLQGGSLTIAEANGTYTVSGTLVSGVGSQITLNYTGAIACEDAQQAAPRKAAMPTNVIAKGRK